MDENQPSLNNLIHIVNTLFIFYFTDNSDVFSFLSQQGFYGVHVWCFPGESSWSQT